MLTITGEIEGVEGPRTEVARPAVRLSPAPLPVELQIVAPPRLLPKPTTRQETLFSLACPDSRGPSVIVDVQSLAVRYANRDGKRILQRGYPVGSPRGVLDFGQSTARERVRLAIRYARAGGSNLVIIDHEAGAVAVRISPLLSAEGLPLALLDFAGERRELNADELAALALAFGLTDAETAIVGLMVDGLSLETIATIRGVQRETVRNQCKRVLSKMRCRRQVDLVRMVLSLCGRSPQPTYF